MSHTSLAIVILAAGKGTRMKSDKPKVMHELAGKPMINWLIDTCETLNPQKIVTVIGPDMPELAGAVSPHETAVQETRDGTAGALKAALPNLKGFDGTVLVLMGDEALVSKETLEDLISANALAVQGFNTSTPHGLGRMILNDDGTLKEIVEERDCSAEQKQITLCNAGNYAVPADNLAGWLEQIGNDNAQGEFYLTDLPAIAAKDGIATKVIESRWEGPWGVNDRVQLAAHEKKAQTILRENAMKDGVSMIDPDTVYFHHDTKIANGVLIEPNVFFGPDVTVDENVHIKAFCHFEGTHIKSETSVGPFARLRPGAEIGENARIGNFVEVKKSTIGKGSKINHLAYVGDTDMGEGVNFSCGAITVNYDGFDKHKTTIGDNVMVGSNVSLVAPITIGDGAFLAAGSTIAKDVEGDALSMSRRDIETKTGWAAKYRKIKSAAKKAAIIAVLCVGTTSVADAKPCQGFVNAMSQLESQMGVPAKTNASYMQPSDANAPAQIRSLNQEIDNLENAIREYNAEKRKRDNITIYPIAD
jgi:bifunctional UDP-N-acetylglucosamine pyrophosphorylase/glucosamine-1-phosphate N-acetyltransferase